MNKNTFGDPKSVLVTLYLIVKSGSKLEQKAYTFTVMNIWSMVLIFADTLALGAILLKVAV